MAHAARLDAMDVIFAENRAAIAALQGDLILARQEAATARAETTALALVVAGGVPLAGGVVVPIIRVISKAEIGIVKTGLVFRPEEIFE